MEAICGHQEEPHEPKNKTTTISTHHIVRGSLEETDQCRLAPFVDYDDFDAAAEKLRNALMDVEPFDVEFSKFELFENGSSATLYLDPEVNVGYFVIFDNTLATKRNSGFIR